MLAVRTPPPASDSEATADELPFLQHPLHDRGQALEDLVAHGCDQLPLPGAGQTLARWRRLAAVAACDLSLVKLFEGHTDALAILGELDGPQPAAGSRWGTWCAEPPDARVVFSGAGDPDDIRLDGTKAWCSGAACLTHAVVSGWNAAGEPCLAAVALAQPGVQVTRNGWEAVGMAASASVDVRFTDARAVMLGAPGDYTRRAGFWHGGAGIAACWYGGARAIATMARELSHGSTEPHRLAHLGAIAVAMGGAAALLREAAACIDAHPEADAQALALRTRLGVEAAAEAVLRHAGRALGAGPLCRNERFARAMADLPVFMRQSHAGARPRGPGPPGHERRSLSVATVTSVERRIDKGEGTPESQWLPWLDGSAMPVRSAESLVPEGMRAVVVAPHPDDEVLAVGGLLAQLAALGREICVVAVTDGTASHPGSRRWPAAELARIRPAESRRALAILGIASEPLRLGFPDGGLQALRDELADGLSAVLRPRDVVFTTWRRDGHPDHEATGEAVAHAASRTGARAIEVPVWAWHWASPGDPRLPWPRAIRVPLGAEVSRRKIRATQAFESQLQFDATTGAQPVLRDSTVARAGRPFEVFFG